MPFYRFNLHSLVSPKSLSERLQREIDNPQSSIDLSPPTLESWFSKEPNDCFVGKVKENLFIIKYECTGYQNSFDPCIRGRINQSEKGSNTEVIMYMNPYGAIFLAFWLFIGANILFVGGLPPLKMFVGGLAFISAGFLFAVGLFFDTAFKAKKMLTLLWNQTNTKILVDTGSLKDKIKCEKCGHPIASNGNKCLYCGANIVSA